MFKTGAEGVDIPLMGTNPAPVKRLLNRKSVTGLEFDWNIGQKRSWNPLSKSTPQHATVLDLAVAGARVLAPADPRLVRGSRVAIGINGNGGLVGIRWCHEAPESELSIFGVEFLQLSDALQAHLTAYLGDRVSMAVEADWSTA